MTLKFEINNNIISESHSDYIPNNDSDNLFASFVFNTKDWRHLEKYAIFWNKKGKSTIRYITDKSHGGCPIPNMALNDLYFYVQIYANDDMLTQKLKVYNYDCQTDINKDCPQHITKTVLFYGELNFVIKFEGKIFESEPIANIHYIILNIPYNARITYKTITENGISIKIKDDGYSLEEIYGTNNLILPIQKMLGKP